MKKVSILLAAIAAAALLAGCAADHSAPPAPGNMSHQGAVHHDVKGEMMDAKGELRMK